MAANHRDKGFRMSHCWSVRCCRLRVWGVRVAATWLRNQHDDDAVSCATPTAHDVTRSPQMSERVVPVRWHLPSSAASRGRPIVYLRGTSYDTAP